VYYLGLQFAIKRFMFGNPEWSSYRATPAARSNTWYSSRLAAELRTKLPNGWLDNPNNSVYALGLDWFQIFSWKTYSVGVIFLMCLDFEDRWQHIRANQVPIAILQGPDENANIKPVLEMIADEFARFGPPPHGRPFRVHNAHDDPENAALEHGILLGGLYGDTPARSKMSGLAGHMSYLACPWCVM
jgi:hypothetical protein